MNELKYVQKLQRQSTLLSLPQSLSEILAMVGSDDFSMEDLTNVILKDPGLVSRILKMANSPFYRQRSQISTVKQAIMMLGVMQVKCLALSAAVFDAASLERKAHIDVKELFGRYLSMAVGCQKTAKAVGFNGAEEAFIAGLIHDIGFIFFILNFPEDYAKVMENLNNYPRLVDAERDIMGIDHAAIGRMLAEKWNFPDVLCQAIGKHHDIPDNIGDITVVEIVQLSELINKPIIDRRPSYLEERLLGLTRLSKLMGLDREVLDDISVQLLTETIKAAEYMGIDIGDPTEVLTRANRELLNSYLTIESLFRERQELSHKILTEERRAAALETKNVAIATLSHYLNNATMAISGRTQLLNLLISKGAITDNEKKMDNILGTIESSVKKIMAVLAELRELTDLENLEKYADSRAINIDDRISMRLIEMEKDTGIIIPDENIMA